MGFTENLIAARKSAGMTQKQVAELVGVTKSTYCNYEKGKRAPDVERLKRIANTLNTSGDILLGTDIYRGVTSPSVAQEPDATKIAPAAEGEGLTETQKAAIQFVLSLPPEKLERFIKMGRAAFEDEK